MFFFSILKETISRSLEGRISHLIPGWKLDSSLKDKQEHQWVVNFKNKECMENFFNFLIVKYRLIKLMKRYNISRFFHKPLLNIQITVNVL